jgi:hypothetical protein
MCQSVEVHHRRSVLDAAQLRLRDPEPASDRALGQRLSPVIGVVTVGADNATEVPIRKRMAKRFMGPEAGWNVGRSDDAVPFRSLAGSAPSRAVVGSQVGAAARTPAWPRCLDHALIQPAQ